MIPQGSWLAMLGGGQLGRMFVEAAHKTGYKVLVLDPDPQSPAGAIADRHLCRAYEDTEALRDIAKTCAAATTEFENIPVSALEFLSAKIPVHPAPRAVGIAQDRIAEKKFLSSAGCAVAPFRAIVTAKDLQDEKTLSPCLPGILKTARLGYDGKGQARVSSATEALEAFARMGNVPCVLEGLVSFVREISVIAVRSTDGNIVVYPPTENRHQNGILDISISPAPNLSTATQNQAMSLAQMILEKIGYVGVMGIEFFVLGDGSLIVNEIAPRPHNSGHYTLDACPVSQFEQQVRALTGMPLGSTAITTPSVMVNILGDAWENGVPDWNVLASAGVRLHLYGKSEPRKGRKMGHFTCLASTPEEALQMAQALKQKIF